MPMEQRDEVEWFEEAPFLVDFMTVTKQTAMKMKEMNVQ